MMPALHRRSARHCPGCPLYLAERAILAARWETEISTHRGKPPVLATPRETSRCFGTGFSEIGYGL